MVNWGARVVHGVMGDWRCIVLGGITSSIRVVVVSSSIGIAIGVGRSTGVSGRDHLRHSGDWSLGHMLSGNGRLGRTSGRRTE